jgi:hypothetical protein
MSGIATAVVGGAIIGGIATSKAAGKAADAQVQSSEAGIAEERRQFDAVQKLLAPYVESGKLAVGGQADILGLNGPGEQGAAIRAIEASPQFSYLTKSGENAILQNASATGGLRGGNTQAALAQFRPQLLSQLIEQQYGRLGQVAGLGQASAAGQAAAAQNTGNSIVDLLAQQGQARAGSALAQGQAIANLANTGSNIATMKLLGAF